MMRHLCDRLLMVHRGRIVKQMETDENFAAPQHFYARALLTATA
jgi:ABC-type oligopeptide transport system ATPase subunit